MKAAMRIEGGAQTSSAVAAAAAAWLPAARDAAKKRLMVVLSDPSVRLPDLGTELASMSGLSDTQSEEQLLTAFKVRGGDCSHLLLRQQT
jgi:hypothetical protein